MLYMFQTFVSLLSGYASYHQHKQLFSELYLGKHNPIYVVCPESKCTDFPMYELAT